MVNLFRGFVFLWLSCIGIVHAADTGWLVSPQNDHARKGNKRTLQACSPLS